MAVVLPCFESKHALLRVEPQSTSSRITLYFESNHSLFRFEPHFGKHAQHVCQQWCQGMKHIERACLKTERPEEPDT